MTPDVGHLWRSRSALHRCAENWVAAVPSCHCPLRCARRALATVPVVLPPLAAEESTLTDERIIEADTAAMAAILCRPPGSRHPESCAKLSGLTGEALAAGAVVAPA